MLDLMKAGTLGRNLFLRDPLIRNTLLILDQVAAGHVGAVLVGHKMGGKSQTLHFVEQFCRFVANKKSMKVFGCKLSFKTEGKASPPGSYQELFHLFNKHVFAAGVIDACKALLSAALSSLEGVTVPEKPDEFLQLCREQFYKMEPIASAQAEEVAYMVMGFYRDCVARDAATKRVELEDLQGLVSYGSELFNRAEAHSFLNGICMFLFDEVGELLNRESTLRGPVREVAEAIILPLVRKVSEQASGSNLFVILTGSTSLAEYVVKEHLHKRVCCLSGIYAEECQALWALWRAHLRETADVDEAENWMLDITAGVVEDAKEDKGTTLGRSLLHHSDGVAGYLVEHFRNAIGCHPAPEDTLAFMVEQQYHKLQERLTKRTGTSSAQVLRDLMSFRKWLEFAQVGLAPSADIAPSAPVMQELLTLLRQEPGIDSCHGYLDMLRSLASLKLTGSFQGAVFQEQVLHAFLAGKRIFATEVIPPTGESGKGKKQPASSGWTCGQTTTFEQPALLVQYQTKACELSQPLYIGPTLAGKELASLMQHPRFLVFAPQSQTFPSIDVSLAEIERDTARVFHCSVSVDAKHFAASIESKPGHLPLSIDCSPPKWFRSKAAATQIDKYKAALLGNVHLKGRKVQHYYAVFDENSKDLLEPTPPFKETFYVFSEKQPLKAQEVVEAKKRKT